MPEEFELINRYFTTTKQRSDVIFGIGDDCALVQVPANQQLAITTDTLVAGVHFPHQTAAEHIGHKAAAVNLSDLAAMGATPAWATLALTLPEADTQWLEDFSRGFFSLLNQYNVQLIGGDTSRGPLTITIAAYGFVSPGQALLRSGAKVGDKIYVTGDLGDAALALHFNSSTKAIAQLQQKLDCPQPRIAMGIALRDIASAAIDISDGLAADLGHILNASKVGAHINVVDLPQSSALQTLIKAGKISKEQAYQAALTGGDDYELCFTVPLAKEAALQQQLSVLNCVCHCIGVIEDQPGLRIYDAVGAALSLAKSGFQHF